LEILGVEQFINEENKGRSRFINKENFTSFEKKERFEYFSRNKQIIDQF